MRERHREIEREGGEGGGGYHTCPATTALACCRWCQGKMETPACSPSSFRHLPRSGPPSERAAAGPGPPPPRQQPLRAVAPSPGCRVTRTGCQEVGARRPPRRASTARARSTQREPSSAQRWLAERTFSAPAVRRAHILIGWLGGGRAPGTGRPRGGRHARHAAGPDSSLNIQRRLPLNLRRARPHPHRSKEAGRNITSR